MDALALLNAALEKDRSPTWEAIARLELARALVPLGSPDEACDLGHQALSSERGVVYVVRAKSLELDAALRDRYQACPWLSSFTSAAVCVPAPHRRTARLDDHGMRPVSGCSRAEALGPGAQQR
jgi:hypothetical protein